MRTISHYAHVNEQRAFERWKTFEYGHAAMKTDGAYTAGIQQKHGNEDPMGREGRQRVTRRQCKTHPNRDKFLSSDG